VCVVSPHPGRFVVVLFIGALASAGCSTESTPGDKAAPLNLDVKLEPVKHKQLLERIAELRGKVVVIDFWGEF
jgi:hypothetical protein